MFYLEERIKRILDELKEDICKCQIPVKEYKHKMTDEKGFEDYSLEDLDWDTFTTDCTWGGHRVYYWFVTEIEIPQSFDGEVVIYDLTTGKEGAWDATNPQFRIFVNGKIRQGLDVNHRSIILTENAKAGEKFRIALLAYTGDENFYLLLKSNISILDRKIEKLYYDLAVPYDVAMLLDKDDKNRIDTINCLNEVINILDLRLPFSTEFYESIGRAQDFVTTEFYEKLCGKSEAEVWCVGHTHIDVAWLWTLAVTKDKAFRSFSTVLDLMKQYPEYILAL